MLSFIFSSQTMCRIMGGNLATILSEVENNFLANEVKHRKSFTYFISHKANCLKHNHSQKYIAKIET